MSKPRRLTQTEYKRYMASREWAVLKQAVKERADDQCERCPNDALIGATHHLTYERLGHELLEDLQGVCGPCHEFLSGLSNHDPVVAYLLRRGQAEETDGDYPTAASWFGLAAQWVTSNPRPEQLLGWLTVAHFQRINRFLTDRRAA